MSGEFAGMLRERVLIERPLATRNAMGLHEIGWQAVCRCLASFVPEGAGSQSVGEAISAMPKYRVILRSRSDIQIDHRLSWKGRRFIVRQLVDDPRQRDRIVLRCEEVRA